MNADKNLLLSPLFAVILIFFPVITQSQRANLSPPRPLCASQYSLASYACIRLPYTPTPPPTPPTPPSPTPSPPTPPPDSPSHHSHHHGHRRSHRHRHREHQETEVEADCCKWLKQMDPECVCDLLVHLPPFLARPRHNYTVLVDESCEVTFPCSGRVIR